MKYNSDWREAQRRLTALWQHERLDRPRVADASAEKKTINDRALTAFHVMPLIPGREGELAADAQRLLESGVCTHVACMMTLVPESDPLDKIPLAAAASVVRAERLMPDGTWQDTAFADASVPVPLLPAKPEVFRMALARDGSEHSGGA